VSIEPGKLHISNWVPMTFIGSFLALVSACILYFVEIMYASHTISFKRIQKTVESKAY
jgi:ABC-type molybdate transport system permease subunit